jgi:uncharacterized protein
MGSAWFRFYAELNDFLPPARRQARFAYPFNLSESVKHAVEALGVPHAEVDLILANGQAVDFGYLLQDADEISVYPMFETLDIAPLTRLRPEPLRQPRFVLDAHLGRLAAYLRLLGIDALYRNDYPDPELARISQEETRILLTRDRGLLKRSQVTRGYCLRSDQPRAQLLEVVRRFDLRRNFQPYRRCLRCNGLLEPVEKQAVLELLPERTRQFYEVFFRCQVCGQVYWKGSHYRHMQALVEEAGRY